MNNSLQHNLIENCNQECEINKFSTIAAGDEDDVADSNFIYILNTILSGTARLNVLLPTATILAFTIFAPLITNDGKCKTLERWLMGFFLALSAASCVFFSFTDSFRTATGRLHYGLATLNGIWTFNGGKTKPCCPSDYRLRWGDLFHASLSLTAFLTFAASHYDVLDCYDLVVPRKVTNAVPLVIGFVDELKRGDVPKSVQCYMNESGASEEEAREYIRFLIGEAWKQMNKERVADSTFSKTFMEIAMNLGGTAQCVYQRGEGYGHSTIQTRDRIWALLFEPNRLS